MKRPAREQARRRVDQALEVLRGALAEYFAALPRTRRTAFRDFDLQRLLKAFIEHFGELPLAWRVRTLAFAAKEARNEVAHYTGSLTPDLALHHLSTLRQLLEALGAERAFDEVERLYHEQLHGLRPQEQPPDASVASGSLGPASSPAERSDDLLSTSGISSKPTGAADRPSAPRGKYLALYRHLNAVHGDVWHTTFTELETILGFDCRSLHAPTRLGGAIRSRTVTPPRSSGPVGRPAMLESKQAWCLSYAPRKVRDLHLPLLVLQPR